MNRTFSAKPAEAAASREWWVVDAEGKASMADFYITRNGGTFVVFQSVVGHDPLLEKLMADNRVSMAN